MDDQLSGFGNPSWLPASVIRAREVEQRAEDRQAREEERARIDHREASHERALAASRAQLLASGEQVSALALIDGTGLGRSVTDVLEAAAAQASQQDAREARRVARDGTAERPEYLGSGEVVLARMAKPKSRRALYTKRLLDAFTRDHPDADVVERAQFASIASKSWRP